MEPVKPTSPQKLSNDPASFYKEAMKNIKPDLKDWISKKAAGLKEASLNPAQLASTVTAAKPANFKNIDDQAMIALIVMQANKNSEAEMKAMMKKLKETKDDKQKMELQLQLQKLTAKQSQAVEMASNLISKLDSTRDSIIRNMR